MLSLADYFLIVNIDLTDINLVSENTDDDEGYEEQKDDNNSEDYEDYEDEDDYEGLG